MIIEDIYSGENERLYSVLLDPEEMRVFSKIQDEDYIEETKSKKKWAKYGTAPILGLSGAIIGSSFGKNGKLSGKGALIGAGIGTVGGHFLGRHSAKKADKELERYLKASESDRKYLREKRAREEQLAAIQAAGYNAGVTGGILSRG